MKLLRVFSWQNFFNQCENFMKKPLQSRPKFFEKKIRENTWDDLRTGINSTSDGICLENVIQMSRNSFLLLEKKVFLKSEQVICIYIFKKSENLC